MDLPNKGDGMDGVSATPLPPKKKVVPVIPGAVPAPRPATKRFADYLFQESPKQLSKKVGREVVVPRLKAGFEEAARNFLSGMLWGSGGSPINPNIIQGTVLRGGNINYNGISTGLSNTTQAAQANVSRGNGNYEDLICASSEHAELLLATMYNLMNEYRVVTVADLYEAANRTPAPSHGSYGWYSFDGARIVKDREGFRLELPRPKLV